MDDNDYFHYEPIEYAHCDDFSDHESQHILEDFISEFDESS
jgi:hypothetical protein